MPHTHLRDGISVVVPVYNSAESLDELVSRLEPVLQSHGGYEIILLNDGSRDSSWQTVTSLAAGHPHVRGINMMRNYGQHNALLCGIRTARFATLLTIDDDLQHSPEDIPKLLAKLHEGYDVVYGSPLHEPHGLWRGLASRITKLALASAMGEQTARHVSAFRVFRTDLRRAFQQYSNSYVSIDVLLTWGTTRFAAVAVPHLERKHGQSNYTFRKLVTHALNMLTGFSTLPLQAAGVTGIVLAIFGFLLLIYVVGRYLLFGTSVPGFPFLASTIAIFSGAQMLALGIIGEYLARIHSRSMERPTYTVAVELPAKDEPQQ